MQQYADVHLLQNHSTCFGCLSHPSSGVHQTVTAASGRGHITRQSNNLPPAWQRRGCIVQHVVTHSLVLLKMDKIIARNMLN